jgi:uncharacterized membrane protein YjjP (DUF1212 family)
MGIGMNPQNEDKILETLKELTVQIAVMNEKLDTNMKKVAKLEDLEKTVYRHDIYMKISMAVVSAVFSLFGVKIFNGGD